MSGHHKACMLARSIHVLTWLAQKQHHSPTSIASFGCHVQAAADNARGAHRQRPIRGSVLVSRGLRGLRETEGI